MDKEFSWEDFPEAGLDIDATPHDLTDDLPDPVTKRMHGQIMEPDTHDPLHDIFKHGLAEWDDFPLAE